MDCLLVGEESVLAQYIKSVLPHDIKLFSTSRRVVFGSPCPSAFRLDLQSKADIDKFSLQTRNGCAVLCAAMSGFAACEQDVQKSHAVNVLHTIMLAERLSLLGWNIIYPSSSSVFHGQATAPHIDMPTNGTSVYGRQKQEVERALLRMPNSLIVRFTKLIPQDFPLFCHWLKALRRGESIRAFSDYVFSPVSMTDAALSLVALMGQKGIWHVSAPDSISYEQAARILVQCCQKRFSMSACDVIGECFYKNATAEYNCTQLDSGQTQAFLQRTFAHSQNVVARWFDDYTQT